MANKKPLVLDALGGFQQLQSTDFLDFNIVTQPSVDNSNKPASTAFTQLLLAGLVPQTTTVNGQALSTNVLLTALDVGLGNVDNIADIDKVVSTFQAAAIATVQASVNNEVNRATIAEGTLTSNINGEITNRTNAIALLVPKTTTVNGHALSGNISVTAADVGLGNVNNTSDVNKPVSTAQAAADSTTLASAKTYADSLVVGLWNDRGSFNASINTFPTTGGSGTAGAILKGDIWTINIAATAGPLLGKSVGATIRALISAPGQTAANWSITDSALGYVPYNSSNPAGYISANQNITISGDATGSGTTAINLTVGKLNGTSLALLNTGILKNTTGTGIPSIAIASDFPILNQDTTGNAATASTVVTNANLTGDVTSVGNATTLSNSGAVAGTYQAITVDAKGRVVNIFVPNKIYLAIAQMSGTTKIPHTTAVPLVTAGTQFWTSTVTPTVIGSKIVIESAAIVDSSVSSATITMALFRNSTYIGHTSVYVRSASNIQQLAMKIVDVTTSLTPVVYSVRIGIDITGTWYVGRGVTATMGGTNKTNVTIFEEL